MRLNHNMQSMDVYMNYKKHIAKGSSALEKVSTGLKINSAKDNPIKLGQSESIRMQIRGLQAAQRNVQDGISMMQTADNAMATVNEALLRMRDLTTQAGNAGFTDWDREVIQNEINQLKEYIDQAANNTEFNGNKILGNENVTHNSFPDYKYMQSGANQSEDVRIPLFNLSTEVLVDSRGNKLSDLDVRRTDIGEALVTIDSAIKTVNSCRSKYGAIQQRFEAIYDNTNESLGSLENADSQIRDTDVAEEIVRVSTMQVLTDASTAILAQTNKFPQDVLAILRNIK